MRVRRALHGFSVASLAAALVLALCVWLRPQLGEQLAVVGLLAALLVAALRACLRVEHAAVARALDRSHGLPDTLQAAVQFSRGSIPNDRGFVAALLREAETAAASVSATRAVPLMLGRSSVLLLAALLLCTLVLSRPATRPRGALTPAGGGKRGAVAQEAVRVDSNLPGGDPHVQYRRIVRDLRGGVLTPEAAIAALLRVERTLRTGPVKALDAGLLAKLTSLFEAPGKRPALRTLAGLSAALARPATADEQREQARFLEEKRRELQRLREQHAKDAAAQRELSELSKRLSEAQRQLQQSQPQVAAQQLDAANRQREQQQEQRDSASEARITQQQAEQLREQLQRQAGAASGQTRAEAERRAQNEQRFGQGAGAASAGAASAPAVGQAQREADTRERTESETGAGGLSNAEAQAPESSAEPDLFARNERQRVTLEDHAAASLSGEGDSRSEVILTAADHGFASTPYRRVYQDYRKHAEELLEKDQVPAAYRYYVRRYFQLIEPRKPRARTALGKAEATRD